MHRERITRSGLWGERAIIDEKEFLTFEDSSQFSWEELQSIMI